MIPITVFAGGTLGIAEGVVGAVVITKIKEDIAPPLMETERKKSDDSYIIDMNEGID